MRISEGTIHLEALREAKFVAFGICVFLAVLVPGLFFYKSIVGGASKSTAASVDVAVRARHEAVLENLNQQINFFATGVWSKAGRAGSLAINRDFFDASSLDVIMIFDQDRKVLDAIRRLPGVSGYSSINQNEAADLVPVDSGFFDAVRDDKVISGVIDFGSQSFVMAIREIKTEKGAKFLLIARPYDFGRLKVDEAKLRDSYFGEIPNAENFRTFRLADDVSLGDVAKQSMVSAIQNRGWSFSLKGNQSVVYTVIDDLLKRPALMVQTPCSLPAYLTSSDYYRNFFGTSLFAGLIGWWLLRRSDLKSRSKTRRFDGLAGLSKENIRILVESFPGFAFVITPDMKYFAASRVLAGVTGQEPSEFVGRSYGDVCSESDDGLLGKAFADLRDRGHWPPVRNVSHSVQGLGESHQFSASAHFLSKQDMMLVLLSKKESAQSARSSDKSSKSKKADSAVA